jgi:hypothetical protein
MAGANRKVMEESFGAPIPQIGVSKGQIETFGHAINDKAIPSRGTSVNVKTGFPDKK